MCVQSKGYAVTQQAKVSPWFAPQIALQTALQPKVVVKQQIGCAVYSLRVALHKNGMSLAGVEPAATTL